MHRLTVLICTHDRAPLLEKVLGSLNSARRPPGWSIDILVAANACRDATHEVLEAHRRKPPDHGDLPVTWFAEPTPGKSRALNAAIPYVESDVVAFVDDDHRVDPGYLEAVCHAADAHPDVALFCGRIFPDWDGGEPAWVHDLGPYRIYPLPVPRFDQGDTGRELTPDVAVPGGGNLFLRTAWLGKVGPFAVDMGPTGHDLGGAEDLDWVLRALRRGARLRYVPEVVQYHHVDADRLTLLYLMKKAYKRSASTIGLDSPNGDGRIPRYLYRKIAEYGVKACTAIGSTRRRFYLVRSAAAIGELAGHLHLRRRRVAGPAAHKALD